MRPTHAATRGDRTYIFDLADEMCKNYVEIVKEDARKKHLSDMEFVNQNARGKP